MKKEGETTSIILDVFNGFLEPKTLGSSNENRQNMLRLIALNPGIYLRKICKVLHKGMGVMQYHLHVLEDEKFIESVKDGRHRRYFLYKNETEDSKMLTCFLQKENIRKVLQYIQEHNTAHHVELATHIGKSSQTITWYMQRLQEKEVINFTKEGKRKTYFITERFKQLLEDCLKDLLATWE